MRFKVQHNWKKNIGKEGAKNILDNMVLIHLRCNNIDTATMISDKLGPYTVQSYGESSNTNIKYNNSSSSMSLISRKLLTPDEVIKIMSPFIIVIIPGEQPALLVVPDISQMHFNKLNGMGTKEENQRLRIERENARKERKISKAKIWNIWDKVKDEDFEEFEEEEIHTLRENWRVNKKRKENIETIPKMDENNN